MGNKHKRPGTDLDDFDGWEGRTPLDDVQPEVAKVSLYDFVVEEKLHAFVRHYRPADEDTPGAEGFDDVRLRDFFKAYVCALGDPLGIYVEMLKLEGFQMDVSIATGEPTIYAIPR